MTVQVDDLLEVACRCEHEGVEDVVNVYQYQYKGTGAETDAIVLDDLADKLDGLYAGFPGIQSSTFIYRDITVRNLTQSTILGVVPWPILTAGGSSAPNLPPGVAGVINMATNVARVVLRKFLGGFVSSALDNDGTFTPALTGIMLAFGAALIPGFSVLTRVYAYGHLSAKTLNFEIPTSITATDVPGYQRRRKQGRGV